MPAIRTNVNSIGINKLMFFFFVLISVISLVLIARCNQKSRSNASAFAYANSYFWGTNAYYTKEQSLKIDHAQAVDLLYKYLSNNNVSTYNTYKSQGVGYKHYFIVNNEYIFSLPHKLDGINMEAYRVDGNTGYIRSTYDPLLTPEMQRRYFGAVYTNHLKL